MKESVFFNFDNIISSNSTNKEGGIHEIISTNNNQLSDDDQNNFKDVLTINKNDKKTSHQDTEGSKKDQNDEEEDEDDWINASVNQSICNEDSEFLKVMYKMNEALIKMEKNKINTDEVVKSRKNLYVKSKNDSQYSEQSKGYEMQPSPHFVNSDLESKNVTSAYEVKITPKILDMILNHGLTRENVQDFLHAEPENVKKFPNEEAKAIIEQLGNEDRVNNDNQTVPVTNQDSVSSGGSQEDSYSVDYSGEVKVKTTDENPHDN